MGKKEDFLNNHNNFSDLLNTFLVLLTIFDQIKCTQSTVVKISIHNSSMGVIFLFAIKYVYLSLFEY